MSSLVETKKKERGMISSLKQSKNIVSRTQPKSENNAGQTITDLQRPCLLKQ